MNPYESRSRKTSQSIHSLLTEENLRKHCASTSKVSHLYLLPMTLGLTFVQPSSETTPSPVQRQKSTRASGSYQTYDDTESEDGEAETLRILELRRVASLEALQAYGGCFVSGFLAMQEPLPWASTTTTLNSTTCADRPRPDSDTLSHMDVQELSSSRLRGWKSMRKLRDFARRASH